MKKSLEGTHFRDKKLSFHSLPMWTVNLLTNTASGVFLGTIVHIFRGMGSFHPLIINISLISITHLRTTINMSAMSHDVCCPLKPVMQIQCMINFLICFIRETP